MSSRPDEESHEIAWFANPALAHIAFKVSSLARLRSVHARVVERNIPIKLVANHHVSFAFISTTLRVIRSKSIGPPEI